MPYVVDGTIRREQTIPDKEGLDHDGDGSFTCSPLFSADYLPLTTGTKKKVGSKKTRPSLCYPLPTLLEGRRLFKALLLLPSECRLINGLCARTVNRAVYNDRATREVYIVGVGIVLGDALLVSNVAGVGDLLHRRTGIDVAAAVAETKRRRSGAAPYITNAEVLAYTILIIIEIMMVTTVEEEIRLCQGGDGGNRHQSYQRKNQHYAL